MTAFHFRLERVLRWRSIELNLEEAKLKRLLGEEAKLQATLAGVQAEITRLPERIAGQADIDGHDLHCLAEYGVYLTHQRDRVKQQCQEKRREIAAQAKIHSQAKQRHRLLEELRARKRGEWEIESNREIEELAQESYLARWASG